ncbi:MAG: peptide deformylase, partial [Alphaproteobacteria bacterium]|nr:peptide deformylase [Alphaproteobacteria bacterium]MBO7641538.1 peptide deformylase [Alphaproteobacteria bacterium]
MELKIYPDPVLAKKCADVEMGDVSVIPILEEMSRKLYEWNGAGLAAPQVGVLKKLVVIDIREEPATLYKMINPKIVWASEEMIDSKEGCLSLPGLRDTVSRHEKVRVEYFDENFEKQTIEGEEFLACCLQHEIDHLSGKLYIDHLSRLKKSRFLSKFRKLQKEAEEDTEEDEE